MGSARRVDGARDEPPVARGEARSARRPTVYPEVRPGCSGDAAAGSRAPSARAGGAGEHRQVPKQERRRGVLVGLQESAWYRGRVVSGTIARADAEGLPA
jgi:hypothetical protein